MNREFSLRMTDKRLRTYLPRDFCKQCGIEPNSPLKITSANGRIIISHAVVIDPDDRTALDNLCYAQACVRGMDAESLKQLQDSVTQRALELAQKTNT